MRNVYMSFLGLGPLDKETKTNHYTPTAYELNGKHARETEFVQAAELEIIGPSLFDLIVIVATETSKKTHFEKLSAELQCLGANVIDCIEISEEMTPEDQWEWFEKILNFIEPGDVLTLDMTHGFRAIPIVFSTALNFLQKARGVILSAVYYGVFEKKRIIDMKDFYVINEWAEAVSRLIEDADAGKLARVAGDASGDHVSELNDPGLIAAFEDLTSAIRNVDVHHIAQKADAALKRVDEKKQSASITGQLLLQLVVDKFTALTIQPTADRLYDKNYFLLQLEIVNLLLEHKLYMQAYTVMREFIGSIGMIEVDKADKNNNKGRNRRKTYAEVFIKMVEIEKDKWNFGEKGKDGEKTFADCCEELLPYYQKLADLNIIQDLKSFAGEMDDYRNGFSHAWTAKAKAREDIPEKGKDYYNNLKSVIDKLEKAGVI